MALDPESPKPKEYDDLVRNGLYDLIEEVEGSLNAIVKAALQHEEAAA